VKATPDSFDDVWELLAFSTREALLLRSFLEYLRSWEDPPEKKQERLQNWRREIGLQLGDPRVLEVADELFQKLRAAPHAERAEILRAALSQTYAAYFGERG